MLLGGHDEQGEIAVEVAGRAEALPGGLRVVEAAAEPGVALAIAAARGALGLQRPAQRGAFVPQNVPFAPERVGRGVLAERGERPLRDFATGPTIARHRLVP